MVYKAERKHNKGFSTADSDLASVGATAQFAASAKADEQEREKEQFRRARKTPEEIYKPKPMSGLK